MKRLVARGLLIVSVFSAFAALGPTPATAHHGRSADGTLHHCRFNPHTHPASFYEGKSPTFIRRHRHHAHQCEAPYPPA